MAAQILEGLLRRREEDEESGKIFLPEGHTVNFEGEGTEALMTQHFHCEIDGFDTVKVPQHDAIFKKKGVNAKGEKRA